VAYYKSFSMIMALSPAKTKSIKTIWKKIVISSIMVG